MKDIEILRDIKDIVSSTQEDMVEMKVSVALLAAQTKRNTESLDEHKKRADHHEAHVKLLEKEVNQRISRVEIPTKVIAYIGIPLGVLLTAIEILAKLNVLK